MKKQTRILNQKYLTISDLREIIPDIGYKSASDIMKQCQEEAIKRNYLLPRTKKIIVPTEIVRELLKI